MYAALWMCSQPSCTSSYPAKHKPKPSFIEAASRIADRGRSTKTRLPASPGLVKYAQCTLTQPNDVATGARARGASHTSAYQPEAAHYRTTRAALRVVDATGLWTPALSPAKTLLRTGRRRRLVVRRPVLQHGRVAAPAHRVRPGRVPRPGPRPRARRRGASSAVRSASDKPMDLIRARSPTPRRPEAVP